MNNIDLMNDARTKKALNQVYRFDCGVMSLGEFLDKNTWVRKSVNIRNHSRKRIHLEYKKIRDTYDYTLWRIENGRELGTGVPKLVYESYDLPEKIIDNRF